MRVRGRTLEHPALNMKLSFAASHFGRTRKAIMMAQVKGGRLYWAVADFHGAVIGAHARHCGAGRGDQIGALSGQSKTPRRGLRGVSNFQHGL